MLDPIIDLIIRIKNGYMSKKYSVFCYYSKYKEKLLIKLKNLNYIKDYQILNNEKTKRIIKIELIYIDKQPPFTNIEIFSKPGRRYYVSYKDLKPVASGFGYSIISTPKGIMTNKEAKVNKIGGELLFNIW